MGRSEAIGAAWGYHDIVSPEGELLGVAATSRSKVCPTCGIQYPADALFCSLDGAPLTSSPRSIDAASATDPYLGREILGHIEIRQLVGIGAMGRVYRAFQRGIDRNVAVKILHRELSANETLVARFQREAKVASRLAHPNVVHVLLVGQLPDGAMHIVMEYLDGLSLQSALAAAGGAMPLPRALHITMQLCDAVGEAHVQGIVHRDLKPENVMLVHRADDPDFVKVLDFGIARLNWGEPSVATAAGLIFGTARYISPEGAKGEPVAPQGDVYSIATMLYQMLAGQTPFDADQAVALLVQQIHDPPPPLKGVARAAYVPAPVAAVVMANLAKMAADRAGDARAFGRALLESAVTSGLSAQDILARPSLVAGRRGSHASAVQMPSLERTKKHSLDPDTAARIGASSAAVGHAVGRTSPTTAYQPSADSALAADGLVAAASRTEIAGPARTPSGAETVKWSAPEGFDAKLALSPQPRLEATMNDGNALPEPMAAIAGDRVLRDASRVRMLSLVITFFCVGVLSMAAVAYRNGLVGGGSAHRAAGIEAAPAPRVSAEPSRDTVPDVPPPAAPEMAVPPLTHPAASASAAAGAVRAILEASSSRPSLGQPVDFSARVVNAPGGSRAKPDTGRFRISGPGLASGTELPASDEGSGVFRTMFTFFQTGRFEVEFSARAMGAPVRAVKVIVVSEPALPPAPAFASTASPPPSTASPPPSTSPSPSTASPPPSTASPPPSTASPPPSTTSPPPSGSTKWL